MFYKYLYNEITHKNYEVYKNPSISELNNLDSIKNFKEMKGVMFQQDIFIYDSNEGDLHDDFIKKMDFGNKAIKLVGIKYNYHENVLLNNDNHKMVVCIC